MKISEKKALEILQKDFEELRQQAKLAASISAFIFQRSEILADRIGQLIATQDGPAPKSVAPNGTSVVSGIPANENPLTLS